MKFRAKIRSLVALITLTLMLPVLGFAETSALINASNQAVIGDDGLGVELRFDSQGQLLSVKSTYSHPVEFTDRRGIAKAYIIAEEKAKANIARYQNQITSSSRIVTEVDDSLNKAARSRSNAGETWSKDSTRNVTESLREITTSSASAMLRGVRVIERSYNEKNEEVVVVVGINRESQMGAEQLRKGLDGANDRSPSGGGQNNQDTFPNVSSEKQRSKDFGGF